MLKFIFGNPEAKKERAERRAREAALEDSRENLFKAADESVTRAFACAAELKFGVPIATKLDAAVWDYGNAIRLYTQLEVVEALTEQETGTMSKLQTHKAGVKSDPARFKATWTKDKVELLEKLETRAEVSQRLAELKEVIAQKKALVNFKIIGDRLLRSGRENIMAKKVAEPRRVIPIMREAYENARFTRTEEAVAMLQGPMTAIAVVRLQAYWRGVTGRRKASRLKWSKDKGRLEASSLFLALDTDHGGTLSREELSDGLSLVGYSEEEIAA
eukprot:CAMPEP_0173412332 /NCGR_PEP_ID=MMETSP1356-20130122/79222_1 /TAXON_ID=77927 ORGANISM="Hemiselmis virescens, Strain PCC157" /NCGR_SAMPLE_ID=MMETSP1356 /ASSEMBLY_ACC=CAM_ASM_000847 /LENGTH=273 /DNA_ID=CAMNT_0014374209 /DNA_START=54 /DNA_END=871 /DNA_ORIENTATION=-